MKFFISLRKLWIREYFSYNLAYIVVIILIPIIVIFVCNSIIILNLLRHSFFSNANGLKANKKRSEQFLELEKYPADEITATTSTQVKYRPYYLSINQIINRVTYQANTSKRITKMLILISFSYALLNLPYLVAWSFFYYGFIFKNEQVIENNYLYACL